MVRSPAHAFPHRGSSSSSHARVRWQPYHAALHSIPPSSSPLAYLVTPASSTASVSPSPLPEPDRTRHALLPPRDPKLRDIQKSKFALSLVDQAVKSLCDIWPQHIIPPVFLSSGRPILPGSVSPPPQNVIHSTSRNTQLPSPISPTTQPTPVVSPIPTHIHPPPQSQRCDIAPIKCFVHEVLRRSRTSGTVLQTALCYLEAIRSKIPDLVRKEQLAFCSSSPVGSAEDRILKQEIDIDIGSDIDIDLGDTTFDASNTLLATVRIDSISHGLGSSFSVDPGLDADKVPAHVSKSNDSLPPLPPLPSPLLCPRRAFLASLILASKFVQDRCYSNRAWAKLSGLPPREIGRCERALGEALEWRLWVGKLPAAQSTSGRPLTKSRSETDIAPITPTVRDLDPTSALSNIVSPAVSRIPPLRRRATVPPGYLYLDGPRVSGSDNVSPVAYSSSPSTPGLSYSPTPTESSLGDRTVQMASFMDVSTPPPGQFATFTGAQNDKVPVTLPVPSNGPFVHTKLQDASLPPHPYQLDSHFWVSHGVIPPNMWTLDDA